MDSDACPGEMFDEVISGSRPVLEMQGEEHNRGLFGKTVSFQKGGHCFRLKRARFVDIRDSKR
jgi:hypothetical protein